MISVAVGSVMRFISVKSDESDTYILKRDYSVKKNIIMEKLINENKSVKDYWEQRLNLQE